jgi:DNA-binding XRE family transcriptional regulator
LKREQLQNFRVKNKLSQEQMANKLDVTFAHYKAIEYCQRNPSFELLRRFKIVFPKASVDKIFLP